MKTPRINVEDGKIRFMTVQFSPDQIAYLDARAKAAQPDPTRPCHFCRQPMGIHRYGGRRGSSPCPKPGEA